jgi:hypothetical protein
LRVGIGVFQNGTWYILRRYGRVTNADLVATITSEIEQIERQLRLQRKVIKNNIGRTLVIEAAEAELKALKTRFKVLKGNLEKLEPA